MGQSPASLAVKAVRMEKTFIISERPYTPTWDCGGRRGSDGGEKCPYLWNILVASTEGNCSGVATEVGTIHTLYCPDWRDASECGAICKEIGQPPCTDTTALEHLEERRWAIVHEWTRSGQNAVETDRQLHLSLKTVQHWTAVYEATGGVKPLPKSGRKPVLTGAAAARAHALLLDPM